MYAVSEGTVSVVLVEGVTDWTDEGLVPFEHPDKKQDIVNKRARHALDFFISFSSLNVCFRTLVAGLAYRAFAILDRILRTLIDTRHAMSAVIAPCGSVILHCYVG